MSQATLTINGILFDLDGTLVLSGNSIIEFWKQFGQKYNIDSHILIQATHGRRTVDVLKQYKPELATQQAAGQLEATIPELWGYMASPVPGAKQLLQSLPEHQWAVVTSGTYPLASAWFKHCLQLSEPHLFITAEDLEVGKPDPQGYLKAKDQLQLKKFIVFEDSEPGIRAGKAANGIVVGVATNFSPELVKSFGADYVIKDYTQVVLKSYDEAQKLLTLCLNEVLLV